MFVGWWVEGEVMMRCARSGCEECEIQLLVPIIESVGCIVSVNKSIQ